MYATVISGWMDRRNNKMVGRQFQEGKKLVASLGWYRTQMQQWTWKHSAYLITLNETQGIFPTYYTDKGRNCRWWWYVVKKKNMTLETDQLRSESCQVLSFTSSVAWKQNSLNCYTSFVLCYRWDFYQTGNVNPVVVFSLTASVT